MFFSVVACGVLGPALGLLVYVALVTLRSEGTLGLAIPPHDIPFAILMLALPYLMFLVFFGPLAAAAGGLLAFGLERFRRSGVALWKLRAGAVAGGAVAGVLVGGLAGAFLGMERDLLILAGACTGTVLGGVGGWRIGRGPKEIADRGPSTRVFASIVSGVGLAVLILMMLLAATMVVAGEFSWPQRYELPDGLKGWVVIRFEIPSCPPMLSAGLFRVVVVSASGDGCTYESPPKGWAYHRYDYVRPDGGRVSLHSTGWGGGGNVWPYSGSVHHGDGRVEHRYVFFIGTEDEFRRGTSNPPR